MRTLKRLVHRLVGVEGSIDAVEPDAVHGWTRNSVLPHERLHVKLVLSGSNQIIGEATADDFREDLLLAGKGDGRHGFSIHLKEPLAAPTIAIVREASTGYRLGKVTIGSRNSLLEGAIDTILAGVVSGWARRPHLPSDRVRVQLIACKNQRIVGEAVAENFREDLRAAGIGDGFHAFVIKMNERSHEAFDAEIRDADTGLTLGQVHLPATNTVFDASAAARALRDQKLAAKIRVLESDNLFNKKEFGIAVFYENILRTYSLFDDDFYKETYMNDGSEYEPIVHYLLIGSKRSYCPNPYFEPSEYFELNADVRMLGLDAAVHYALHGWREGRPTGSRFDGPSYLKRYTDVEESGLNPLHHYLEYGRNEGRLPFFSSNSGLPPSTGLGNSSKRTIILVAHDCNVGGAQLLLQNLAEWFLNHTKYAVRVVAVRDGSHRTLFESIAPLHVLPHEVSDVSKAALNEFIGGDAELIFVNSAAGARFFEFWEGDTPAVAYIHELQRVLERFPGSIETLNERCDHLIAGSGAVMDNLIQQHGVEPGKVKLVYNFIRNSQAVRSCPEHRVHMRSALGFSDDDFVVLGCGLMHWRKAPDKFIRVAQLVASQAPQRCKFVWVGDGPDEEECRDLIEQLGLGSEVVLLGHRSDVDRIMEAADLFLLTSEEDPFPLVCLSAAAKDAPIVCFDASGGIPELVSLGCGTIVPFGDIDKMAEAVLGYVYDPTALQKHGKTGGELVRENFTERHAGPRILEICRRAMRTKPYVSVVVPNYNYARFLPQRLESIYGQTFQDFEVILLDDASTDDSASILEEFAASHPSTRLIKNERNSGSPFTQWIRGMDAAASELIWIAEADDYCEPNLLETLVSAMDDRNVFLAHAMSVPVDSECNTIGDYRPLYLDRIAKGRWDSDYVSADHVEIEAGLAVANVIPNASAVLFRRFAAEKEFVEQVAPMRMCGDWLFYVRALRGGNVSFSAAPLNYHRRHGGTVTHRTEGSLKYFSELATVRSYVAFNYDLSEDTRMRSEEFTSSDLERFSIADPDIRARVLKNAVPANDKYLPSLLVVTSDLSPGGGQMFAVRLANAWSRYGGRAVLMSVGKYPAHPKVVGKVDPRVALFDANNPEFSFGSLIRDFDIDIVHSSLWWADAYVHEHLAELPEHVAWCVTMHGCYETLLERPETDETFASRVPDMVRRADEWIYIADKNLRVFEQIAWPENLSKIDNGFAPEPIVGMTRQDLGLRANSLVLLIVSRAIAEKGWLEAVEVAERLNRRGVDVDLLLAGEGPIEEELRQNSTSPFVHVLGHVDNVQDYVNLADVGLLPSYFVGESMPLSIIEMIAQGKPVVASNAGEIQDMLTLRGKRTARLAGTIVKLVDGKVSVDELEKAVLAFADAKSRRRAGKVAREIFAKRFEMTGMLSRYEAIYQRAILRKKGSARHSSHL